MNSSENSKFEIDYDTCHMIDIDYLKKQFEPTEDDKEFEYNPMSISKIQNYNPIYTIFFKMDENNYNKICFSNKYKFVDFSTIQESLTKRNVPSKIFIKYSPLLDPIRYMIGKYELNNANLTELPQFNSDTTNCNNKLLSINNSSYIDCFFSFLASKLLHNYNFNNSIDFYGSFLSVQDKYKMDISDDFEYLNESNYFLNNLNKKYKITKSDLLNVVMNNNSRRNKNKINISESNLNICNIENDIVDDLQIEEIVESNEIEEVYSKNTNNNSSSDSSESDNDSDSDYSNESGDSDDDSEDSGESDETEDSDEDSDESNESSSVPEETVFSYIDNFPVQMICIEKCKDTLDSLFENEKMDDENGSSALFQVIMSLIAYQKAFSFTHNDLHTNNVMYSETNQEFLYYKYNRKIYKVPTYGKIFKLIDFGRSIYKFKGKIFCSDSFAPGGDAATQYNCEPYLNENKPVIEPNFSFDLCRLGCSIYDFIIDDEEEAEMNELQKTIYRWCLDDSNLSILYKKNGNERYPNFKLYKMIARTVHNHTPQKQLEFPFFNQYEIDSQIDTNIEIINIDKIHSYV
tara:strand:- start:404 stop:2128 length:1725 start_codon:yes stop_codon:yes gene_type:complete